MIKNKLNLNDLVQITWLDSWCTVEDDPTGDVYLITVGFFKSQDSNYICLAQNLQIEKNRITDSSPYMKVNTRWVKSIKIIKKGVGYGRGNMGSDKRPEARHKQNKKPQKGLYLQPSMLV